MDERDHTRKEAGAVEQALYYQDVCTTDAQDLSAYYGELYELYATDVLRMCYFYLADRGKAEDVVQDVFVRLMTTNPALQPGKEKAWLLTCAANACKDHLRSFWKKHMVALDDTITFSGEGDKELWEAVNTLPPKYRVVVHLYYYEGYPQDEIAEILRISRTAVQTRMSRARNQLKEVLREYA
jgi:RNA polymerase sigma-70 factor (ECF subfamily)